MFHWSDLPKRDSIDEGVVHTNVFVGGSKQDLKDYFLLFPNHINLGFDNFAETEAQRRKYRGTGLVTLAIGRGKTTAMLHAGKPSEAACSMTANALVDHGCGGRALNATLAAEDLVGTPEFRQLLDQLIDRILCVAEGSLKGLVYRRLGSEAGATNNGAGPVIDEAILSALVKLGVPVMHIVDNLGPLAFLGQATRARPNAGAALLYETAKSVGPVAPGRASVSRQQWLHQLRPHRHDREQMKWELFADAVAMNSVQMRAHLNVVVPNNQNNGALGGIMSRQVDLSGRLTQDDIAGQVAEPMRDAWNERLSEAARVAIDVDLEWRDEGSPRSRTTLDGILNSAGDWDAEATVAAVEAPPATRRLGITFRTRDGGRYDGDRLSDLFSTNPESFEDFARRIQLLGSFRHRLAAELNDVRDDLDELEARIPHAEDAVARWHGRLFGPRSWWPTRMSQPRFENAIEELRDLTDRRAARAAEVDALSRVAAEVEKESDYHIGLAEKVGGVLDAFVPRGSLAAAPRYVLVAPVESVFDRILALPELPRDRQLIALCSAATALTSDGFARIVNAPNGRLDALAEAVVNGRYPVVAPSHGSRPKEHLSEVIYCCPPMRDGQEQELRRQIRTRHAEAQVMFTDTLTFGATVARVSLHRFNDANEIFDGLRGCDVHDAAADQLGLLNSADNFDGVKRLGGRLEGGRIVFSHGSNGDA
jgi:hypothetical protein